MKTEQVKEILNWVKTTDLTSVALKEKGSGFSFTTSEHADESFAEMPPAHYQSVTAPAIGAFRWSRPGHPQKVEEGTSLLATAKTRKACEAMVSLASATSLEISRSRGIDFPFHQILLQRSRTA